MGNPLLVHRRTRVRFLLSALWGATLFLTLFGCGSGPPKPGPAQPLPTNEQTDVSPLETLVPFQRIGPGDLLEVIVRRGAGEERYTPTVKEDGTVSVSFVDVSIAGLSPGQAAVKIQVELANLIREPRVEVLLTKQAVSTQKVLVLGQINNPGVYPLQRNHRVLQAILEANGPTETALLEEVRIIRNGSTDPVILAANVDRLVNKGDLSQNLLLQQNDIVYIPRTKIGNWNAWVESIRPTLEVLIGIPVKTIFEIVLIKEVLDNN